MKSLLFEIENRPWKALLLYCLPVGAGAKAQALSLRERERERKRKRGETAPKRLLPKDSKPGIPKYWDIARLAWFQDLPDSKCVSCKPIPGPVFLLASARQDFRTSLIPGLVWFQDLPDFKICLLPEDSKTCILIVIKLNLPDSRTCPILRFTWPQNLSTNLSRNMLLTACWGSS